MKRYRFLKIAFLLFLFFFLIRGQIFRACIKYSSIGERADQIIQNEQLIKALSEFQNSKPLSTLKIIETSRKITDGRLSFTMGDSSNNPNGVYAEKKANCVGYAALFSAVANYISEEQDLADQIEIRHLVGKLDLFGADIHAIFGDHPFFQDHDFVEVSDLKTGKQYYIDPSVSDYLGIRFVTLR